MKRPFAGTFPITQEWGVNPSSYSQFGLKGHNGVDYGTPTGTPILAPHSGKIIEAAYDQYGYGNYVKIENDKEGSILAHFKSFNVNVGDTVSEGQQVGVSNNTGNSTGPHLHWGYYRMPRNKSDGFSGTTNPYPYLSENNPPNGMETSPTDDCPAKLKDKIELETFLRGEIKKKDDELEALKATNTTLSTQNITLTNDLKAEKEHSQVTLDSELAKQRELLLTESINERKALEQEIERLKKLPTKIVKVETPLDERFKGKSTKIKLQAIATIALA